MRTIKNVPNGVRSEISVMYNVNLGEEIICPVCGTIFEVTEDTKYFISGDYTCNWNCFLDEAKRRDAKEKK